MARGVPFSWQEVFDLLPYREIWLVDYEFTGGNGNPPVPLCLVAYECRTERTIRIWREDFPPAPPYATDESSLFVAYNAQAELGCHLALDWELPKRILDLYSIFKSILNDSREGKKPNANLLSAMLYFGLNCMGAEEKSDMIKLILTGGPWCNRDREKILEYCEGDVRALHRLLPAIAPYIELNAALLWGRFHCALARMSRTGIPLDMPLLQQLREHWEGIKTNLVEDIDRNYHVYEGTTFKTDRFCNYLAEQGIPWSTTMAGRLDLKEKTFREIGQTYPQLDLLRQLRHSLGGMRANQLEVGADGRNRTAFFPWGTKTGRNAPSTTRFIFGPAAWMRGLIKPGIGRGVAYCDWDQQEYAIAASKSEDLAMIDAYRSGDPYFSLAIKAGAVPPDAVREDYEQVREQYKTASLGVLYGLEAASLAARLDQPALKAREILAAHRAVFHGYWKWSQGVQDEAAIRDVIYSRFGWPMRVVSGFNPRSIRNFPMQSYGADMMRLACCLATERGVTVCCPVHDAVLIEAALDDLDHAVDVTLDAMREASRIVLNGFELTASAKIVRFPDRYMDKRGVAMWQRVMAALAACSTGKAAE